MAAQAPRPVTILQTGKHMEPEQAQEIGARHPGHPLRVLSFNELRGGLPMSLLRQLGQPSEVLYVTCLHVGERSRMAYLRGLSLFFPARKVIFVDTFGHEEPQRKRDFFLRDLPRLAWQLPAAALVLAFTWLAVTVLGLEPVRRRLKVHPRPQTASGRQTTVFFPWSLMPDTVNNMQVGGEISHVVGFLQGLDALGIRTRLFTTRKITNQNIKGENTVIDESGLPPWPGEVKFMAYNWKILPASWKYIRKEKPQLIYHRATAFGITGALMSIFHRIPLIVEFNSSDVWEARNAGGIRFMGLLERCEKLSIAYSEKITVVSEEVRDDFVRTGVRPEQVVVNPNGVNPDLFCPGTGFTKADAVPGLSEDTILVGFLGVFQAHHGLPTLARAIPLVAAARPDIHFLLIGDGPLRPEVDRILAAAGVTDRVTLTGKIPHHTVPGMLDACDILASPHQNMYDGTPFFGSPTKIFEYMAMGKGIVASRIGQLERILEHGRTAWLVPYENPPALAEGILKLAGDKQLRDDLGRAARELVLERYTWKMNAWRAIEPVMGVVGTAHSRAEEQPA